MNEIFIDGRPLDLSTDTQIVQTFQANNLERPEQIQAHYSNQFEVPATQPNRDALEYADQVNSQTGKPYRKLDARIIAQGVETVPYGIGSLEESQNGKFALQIFSGNKNFFEVLADKSIRDLPLSEFDHDYTLQNVINSRGHYVAQGYVYDIIHRGKDGQESAVRWNDLYPSTFVRVIWDKIFTQAGFAYQWERDDEGLFDKLLLPTVAPPKLEEQYRKAREIFVGRNGPEIGRSNHGSFASQGEKDAWIIAYDLDSQQKKYKDGKLVAVYEFKQGDAGRWNFDTYTSDGYYYVDVLASIAVKGFAIVSQVRVELQLMRNGEQIAKVDKTFENGIFVAAKPVNDFLVMDEQKVLLKPGDTLQMRASVHKPKDASSFDVRISIPEGQGLDIRVRPEFPVGGRVRLNNWLPDISQKEFVKSVIHLYGLMMQTDSYTSTIRINYFSDLLKRTEDGWVDWSGKLTLEPAPVTRYTFGSYAQRNFIRYQGDDKDQESQWADGELTVDNQKLEKEKDLITLPFAATRTQGGVPFIEMFKGKQVQESQKDGSIKLVTQYDEVAAVPRLLIRDDLQIGYTYLDEYDQVINMPDEGRPISRFMPELHLKNSIIPRYYNAYQGILDNTRFIKVYLLLTPADIAELDFARPVWLDHFGECFYLNQVSQWRAGVPCECELVRL